MYVKPTRPREAVADAVARAVAGRTWSGSVAELLALIERAATPAEHADRAWPASPGALAAVLRSQSDGLRDHGLRLSVMPADLLIEPIPPMPIGAKPNAGRGARAAA